MMKILKVMITKSKFLNYIGLVFLGMSFLSVNLTTQIGNIFKNDDSKRILQLKINQDTSLTLIGNQMWCKYNLCTDTFRNGDTIFHATNNREWSYASKNRIPAWCYLNNDSIYNNTCGKLYNWYAIADPRSIFPVGWKIPTLEDWNEMITTLGGKKASAKKMTNKKWMGEWGNNESGFNAFPAGMRTMDTFVLYGGHTAIWWLNTSEDDKRSISYVLNGKFPGYAIFPKGYGCSVRLLICNDSLHSWK